MDPLTVAQIGGIAGQTLLGFGRQEQEREIADANFRMQQSNAEYMRSAQQVTWDREDSAVRRRVNDLNAAGLSPTLAAGSSAGTSSPIQIQAPQRQQSYRHMPGSDVMDAVTRMNQQAMTESSVRLQEAQREKIENETSENRMSFDLNFRLLQHQLDKLGIDSGRSAVQRQMEDIDLRRYKKTNLRPGESSILKSYNDVSSLLGLQSNDRDGSNADAAAVTNDWDSLRNIDKQGIIDREYKRRYGESPGFFKSDVENKRLKGIQNDLEYRGRNR